MDIKEFVWQKERREMWEAARKQTKEKLAPMLKAIKEKDDDTRND